MISKTRHIFSLIPQKIPEKTMHQEATAILFPENNLGIGFVVILNEKIMIVVVGIACGPDVKLPGSHQCLRGTCGFFQKLLARKPNLRVVFAKGTFVQTHVL